jgi:hypothetical protein
MRLFFPGIEAGSPEDAAALARDSATDEAELIADCDGETFAALVDVVGDEQYKHSPTIDFEAERQRRAVSALLAALKAVLPYAENEAASLYQCWQRDGDAAIKKAADACERVLEQARAALATAT